MLVSAVSHCGPLYQRRLSTISAGSMPLERMSAGLWYDGTCRHCENWVFCWIWATLFDAKVLSKCGGVLSQCTTIIESVHNIVCSNGILKALTVLITRLVNRAAAHSSSRSRVCDLRGTIRDFEQIRCTEVRPA